MPTTPDSIDEAHRLLNRCVELTDKLTPWPSHMLTHTELTELHELHETCARLNRLMVELGAPAVRWSTFDRYARQASAT